MELGDVSFIAFYALLIRLNAKSHVWRLLKRTDQSPFASELFSKFIAFFFIDSQHVPLLEALNDSTRFIRIRTCVSRVNFGSIVLKDIALFR